MLTPAPKRVLFVQHASDLSGSAISGHLIAQGLRSAGWMVDVAFSRPGLVASMYEDIGCSRFYVAHKNWLRGGNSVQWLRRVSQEVIRSRSFVRLLRERQPDLVYVNSLVSLAGALASRKLRLPCIWHVRELYSDVGGEMKAPPLGMRGLVRRIIRSCADRTIVISQAVADNVLPGSNTTVVPNAVSEQFFRTDLDRASCRQTFSLPAKAPIVGVAGTLRPVKGVEFFLNAASLMVRSGSLCYFAVAGDGKPEYLAQIRRQVAELGLADRVLFLGTVRQMPEFYAACNAICIPSRSESFGRTAIEAFAVGTPVVGSAVGGILETVENEQTGLLVPYADSNGLAEALTRVLNDHQLRSDLISAAKKKAHAQFSASSHQARINSIVEDVVAQKKPAPAGAR